MNNCSFIGRLTDKPELAGEDKKQYCRFTLAVQRDKDNADFIDAVAFGSYANVITKPIKAKCLESPAEWKPESTPTKTMFAGSRRVL